MASKTNSGDNLGGAIFFVFRKKHVPGILGRALVILSSKMMNILIIYGIFASKTNSGDNLGGTNFLFSEKNTSLEFWDAFW